MKHDVIKLQNFIMATRDSGYKSTASALAEVIDNSIEAQAKTIEIRITKNGSDEEGIYTVLIIDDGIGMTPAELNIALQFGGSSKFNSRSGLGRYGMGLPNSSLSQSRRVEVITWRNQSNIYKNHLDVDEVVTGRYKTLPSPKKIPSNAFITPFKSGTIVKWAKCDRISYKNLKTLLKNLQYDLGRIFRHHLWDGVEIKINEQPILPIDPLFTKGGINLIGGTQYGKILRYPVKVPGSTKNKTSDIFVRFVELPVDEWYKYSNEEKSQLMIIKKAGVSILRSKREIDYGWFFMGSKRKENYDDWWRCEISFSPDLDELFGVTHTKQEIHPTEELKQILSTDLEHIARTLNSRVRNKFLDVKKGEPLFLSKKHLEGIDSIIEPPESQAEPERKNDKSSHSKKGFFLNKKQILKGMTYQLSFDQIEDESFFLSKFSKDGITLSINKNHPFFDKLYEPLQNAGNLYYHFLKQLEILIFAAARAETFIKDEKEKRLVAIYKENWSKVLATFLS